MHQIEAWLTGRSSHGRTHTEWRRMQPQLNQNVTSSTTCVSRETLPGFPMRKSWRFLNETIHQRIKRSFSSGLPKMIADNGIDDDACQCQQ